MSDPHDPAIRTDIPHSARIWNFWMGGTDNYPVDRAVGEESLKIDPDIAPMTVQCRQFLIRAVRYLAGEAGVRQFLDVGTGLPTMQNTHEVAQETAPDSRVVYVDHDPLVLRYARTLLANTTDGGVTTYVDADYHEPARVIADARNILNLTRPVAVMFMGSLGHAGTHAEMLGVVRAMMDAVPSGSYLVLYDGITERQSYVTLCEEYAKSGGLAYLPRTPEEIRAAFDGLELVEPGCVPVTEWRREPRPDDTPRIPSAYCGVARKP